MERAEQQGSQDQQLEGALHDLPVRHGRYSTINGRQATIDLWREPGTSSTSGRESCGIEPMEAIRSATYWPALLTGVADQVGTISGRGSAKEADHWHSSAVEE
ncbi:MAG: hypothetical protein GEU99_12980 [Luteitalea sp.]|nr:hypothetical protein [Luteitalea sp.]